MYKKLLAVSTATIIGTATLFSTFTSFAATSTTTTSESRPQKPENEITGKITAISANSITISVANRKEMEKPAEGSTPPEKPANDNSTDTTKKEKPNMDNMFTLTGETKTIDISSAKFEQGHGGKPPKDGQTTTTETTQAQKALTYSDFAIGDYVNIELTAKDSTTAKTVREAGGMGGGDHGGNGQQPPEKK